MKLKCDNCGEILERGLENITKHTYECKAAVTTNINDTYSYTTYPYFSATPIKEEIIELNKII